MTGTGWHGLAIACGNCSEAIAAHSRADQGGAGIEFR
jgi:hypothetical protein